MKHIDDLFRDGLSGRKGDVPADMWNRIKANKPAIPAGEALDRKFSDALRDREAPVPAGMWERIVAARALPRKRAYAALAALLFLLFSIGLYFFLTPEPQPVPTTVPELAQPAVPVAAATAPTLRESQDSPLPSNSSRQVAGNLVAVPPNPAPAAEPSIAGSSTSTANPASVGFNASSGLNPVQNADETDRDLQAELPLDQALTDADGPVPPGTELPQTTAASARLARSAAAAFLPETAIEALDNDFAPEMDFSKRNYRIKPSKNGGFRRAPRHRSQTEMLFGVAYANQILSTNAPENRNLLAARENSEFPEFSFQVTLRQAYRLTDRITLRGGLTFLDIRNEFEYEAIVNNEVRLIRKNNHIRMLEVPVLAGLTLPGKRLHVSLNAGPVFNLTTAAQGQFLDPSVAEPRDLREDGGFRSYTGVGYMASITTTYAIGKKDPFVLVLEPFFKHYPGSFTQPTAGIQESYWLAGLQLGVRKSL